jgi:hypothetical protein
VENLESADQISKTKSVNPLNIAGWKAKESYGSFNTWRALLAWNSSSHRAAFRYFGVGLPDLIFDRYNQIASLILQNRQSMAGFCVNANVT